MKLHECTCQLEILRIMLLGAHYLLQEGGIGLCYIDTDGRGVGPGRLPLGPTPFNSQVGDMPLASFPQGADHPGQGPPGTPTADQGRARVPSEGDGAGGRGGRGFSLQSQSGWKVPITGKGTRGYTSGMAGFGE